MCGIIAITSKNDVVPDLISGLERLEYRGYDSAGIAVATSGDSPALAVRRAVGRLTALRDCISKAPVTGNSGIGHTRWATHGRPTLCNAHPHSAGQVTVVHNGIIENSNELRKVLEASGRTLSSETDTEVIPHLIDEELASGASPLVALQRVTKLLRGAYALAVICESEPSWIYLARRGSPLAIGYGKKEQDGTMDMYAGSDAIAMTPLTNRIAYLEEGDIAVISRVGALVFDDRGKNVDRPIHEVASETEGPGTRTLPHYMLKEIYEQPTILQRMLEDTGALQKIFSSPKNQTSVDPRRFDRVILVACGTSYHAAMVAKYWLESWSGIAAEVEIASEYRYREKVLTGRELAVFISQSGETADTLAALRQIGGNVALRLAILNVPSSSMAREADTYIDIQAGREIGVASTKAFTAQLMALAILALRLGLERGAIGGDKFSTLQGELAAIPGLVSAVLSLEEGIKTQARRLASADAAFFIGRGVCYPIALEGALKLKEIGYVKTEGYAAGELKHGPIALIEDCFPSIVLAPSGPLHEKTMSNCAEVKARGADVLLLTDVSEVNEPNAILLPRTREMLSCFTTVVALQLLSYHISVLRGCDVDKPRNLAKSVTVE